MLTIAKVLNNNIAIVVDESGHDCIAMGRGLAFGRKHGDQLDEASVERLFTQHVPELSRRLSDLIALIPEEYFEAAQDIIEHTRLRLGRELDDGIYLALADHIHFTIERARTGQLVANRLTFETRLVYRDEFECGLTAVSYLERVFDVKLPEDEAAFIALHFVNASTGVGMEATTEMADIIQRAIGIVREELGVGLDEDSLAYYRFMVHLKLFAQRAVSPAHAAAETLPEDRRLIALVEREYRVAGACADAIVDFVAREHGYEVPRNEWMYLTMHIERVRASEREQGRGP